jgi:hypothetical protein
MDKFTEKIHMEYLQEEIVKMQKTAEGLQKMINKKDLIEDDDLIETLQKLRFTTLNNIKNKEEKLKEIYNKKMKIENH